MDPIIQELSDAVAALRQHNDTKLAEIERNGAPRAETQTALDRANEAISGAQTKLEALEVKAAEDRATLAALETRLNRPLTGGRGGAMDDERVERYAAWQGALQNKKIDPAHIDLDWINRYRGALDDYMRHGDKFAARESMEILNATAATAGDNPSGGYYVDPDTNGRLVTFLYETSPIRRLARKQVTSGDRLQGKVQLGEAGYGWVGETETRPATDVTSVFEWEVPLREMYANPGATQRLLDEASIDVAGWLESEVRRKFARAEATAFVSGTGPKQPRGFTTYAAGTPAATAVGWPVVQQVASLAAATLTADGLVALVDSMKVDFLPNAVFGMRRATQTVIRQMKDGDGNYLWQPDFAAPAKSTLLGYPVELMADMPAIGAGAEPIVFADFFEAYQIADSPKGIRVLVDPYTNKPYVQFYTTMPVGGDVVNFDAIKLQTCSAS